MKRFFSLFFPLFLLSLSLFFIGCSKTHIYRGEKKTGHTILTANSDTAIILHADLIQGEDDTLGVRTRYFRELKDLLQEEYKDNLYVFEHNQPLIPPKNKKLIILVIGEIWSGKGRNDGTSVAKVRKSVLIGNIQRSWDEIQNKRWGREWLFASGNLNLLFFAETPKTFNMLVVSNSESTETHVYNGGISRHSFSGTRFQQNDPFLTVDIDDYLKQDALRLDLGVEEVQYDSFQKQSANFLPPLAQMLANRQMIKLKNP